MRRRKGPKVPYTLVLIITVAQIIRCLRISNKQTNRHIKNLDICYSDTEFSVVFCLSCLLCALVCVAVLFLLFAIVHVICPQNHSIPLQRVYHILCVAYFGTRKISMHEKIRLENIRNYFCNVLDPYHFYTVWPFFGNFFFLCDRINTKYHTERFSEIFSKNKNVGCLCECECLGVFSG